MTTKTLREIAAEGVALAEKATPGPWSTANPDDQSSMNMVLVQTGAADVEADPAWKAEDCGRVVAITLLQDPRYADHDSELWDENAAMIAHAGTHYGAICAALIEAEALLREARPWVEPCVCTGAHADEQIVALLARIDAFLGGAPPVSVPRDAFSDGEPASVDFGAILRDLGPKRKGGA